MPIDYLISFHIDANIQSEHDRFCKGSGTLELLIYVYALLLICSLSYIDANSQAQPLNPSLKVTAIFWNARYRVPHAPAITQPTCLRLHGHSSEIS